MVGWLVEYGRVEIAGGWGAGGVMGYHSLELLAESVQVVIIIITMVGWPSNYLSEHDTPSQYSFR